MTKNFNEAQFGAMRTAFLTAFPKIFTDIDYSIDFFSKMKNLATKKGFAFMPSHFTNEMAIEIEARHKALNKDLQKNITKDTLVIEIACGISPRRLEFKDYEYAELDFKPVIEIKKDIYKSLGFSNLTNSLFEVDLADTQELRKSLKKVLKTKTYKNVVVLNEGLFWYLTKDEIRNMTNEISLALKDIDWKWITSDCPTLSKLDANYRSIIADSAKVKRGTFADYQDFTVFFDELCLKNSSYKLSNFVKVKDLSSANLFAVSEEQTLNRINTYTDISILSKK